MVSLILIFKWSGRITPDEYYLLGQQKTFIIVEGSVKLMFFCHKKKNEN